MESIKWGIIGCGDVTEVKSGPAFNKVNGSSLVAVMRRDGDKAKDYASRHGIPKWYADARQLINDPDINAVYVATPPLHHEEYAIAALEAGKPVYLEKPMALNEASCQRISDVAVRNNVPLVVAHYRRALPLFITIKELIDSSAIGEIRFVNLQLWRPPKSGIIARSEVNWRVDPTQSGGGLFHDLAPHQLDLMLDYFGEIKKASGVSANQGGLYLADDIVSGEIVFKSGVFFKGLWCFTVCAEAAKDHCEIIGAEGKISFSFFSNRYILSRNGIEQPVEFVMPQHIQQPMIEKVVNYFLGKGPNPCSGEEAIAVMKVMDCFTASTSPGPHEALLPAGSSTADQ